MTLLKLHKNLDFMHMRIGMRTIKTSFSVMICLALGRLFLKPPPPIYACIAAILTMRDTVDNSIKYGITRILATLLGGAIGLLILGLNVTTLSPWIQIPIIGLVTIFTIHITIAIKRPDATALSTIIFLIVVLDHANDKYVYALRRMIETLLGIVVAVACNKFINFKHIEKEN